MTHRDGFSALPAIASQRLVLAEKGREALKRSNYKAILSNLPMAVGA